MKSFSLLHCYPAGFGQSGNFSIFDCEAETKLEAVKKLRSASVLCWMGTGISRRGK